MKRLSIILNMAAVMLLVAVLGCGSSGSGIKSEPGKSSYERSTTVEVDNPAISLADYLRRLPGVQVRGNGPGASIRINGVSSFILTTEPLFIVDGVQVGRSFSNVYSLLSPSMVESIRVLKRADAAAYGIQGANGVIIITTKKG